MAHTDARHESHGAKVQHKTNVKPGGHGLSLHARKTAAIQQKIRDQKSWRFGRKSGKRETMAERSVA